MKKLVNYIIEIRGDYKKIVRSKRKYKIPDFSLFWFNEEFENELNIGIEPSENVYKKHTVFNPSIQNYEDYDPNIANKLLELIEKKAEELEKENQKQ